MLKNSKFSLIRFLALWIIPAMCVGSMMYIISKLTYIFKWGNHWNSNRYYDWLYFMEMTLIIFLFVALIYIFVYWFLDSQLLVPIFDNKRIFSIIWSILFGIGMFLFVILNSMGSITFFDSLKIIIIMGIIGAFIPFLDFKIQKKMRSKK